MARSQWFASVLTSVALIGALIALSLADPRWEPEPTSVSLPSASRQRLQGLADAGPRRSIDTGPAEGVVAELRRTQLSLPARGVPASQLAVSHGRIGRVGRDRFVVVEPGTTKSPLTFELPGAQLVARVPGGLLAVGQRSMLLLPNAEQQPESWPRVTLLPGSRLLADRIEPSRVWVMHDGAGSLYGYHLVPGTDPLLPLTHQVPLTGPKPDLLLALDDGSFVYHTGEGWERMFAQGRRFPLRGLADKPRAIRTLRASRLDQFFVVFEDASVERVQIQDRLRSVWRRELGSLPVDIASLGDRLVLLRSQPVPQGLRWRLELIGKTEGESEAVTLDLSPRSELRGDWVPSLLASHGLATSKRWIALGGIESLRVWDPALEPVSLPE